MWSVHPWLFCCWIIPYSVTYVCVCIYIYPLLYKDWKNGYDIGKCARFPKIVVRDDFIVILPVITTLLFLSATCMFLFLFPGLPFSICMRYSGGLLYRREEHNILLVCLALWHLNKLERCINLVKDWGQSDGWTGIISHFSCSVFIAINFKQGNRLQGVCCIRKEVCTLLWLIGVLVEPSSHFPGWVNWNR